MSVAIGIDLLDPFEYVVYTFLLRPCLLPGSGSEGGERTISHRRIRITTTADVRKTRNAAASPSTTEYRGEIQRQKICRLRLRQAR